MPEGNHPCAIFQDALDQAQLEFQQLLIQSDEILDALLIADQLILDRQEALQNCLAENPMRQSPPTMARNNSDRVEKLQRLLKIVTK